MTEFMFRLLSKLCARSLSDTGIRKWTCTQFRQFRILKY